MASATSLVDMKILAFIRQRSFARYVMIDLAEAALRLGWAVKWLDLEGLLYANADRPRSEKQEVVAGALDEIEQFDPDVVFTYGLEYVEKVFESFLPDNDARFHQLVRRPAVYFFFDFGFPFDRPPCPETVEYLRSLQSWRSLVLCWDQAAIKAMGRFGVWKTLHFPMAVNPEIFRGPEDRAQPTDPIPVVFVGGPTDERVALLESIADLGLSIYGYDPQRWAGSPRLRSCYVGEIWERHQLRRIYSRARISLNITRPHGVTSLNMRVYEAMACGSLMLTDAKSDAPRLFEVGTELAVYHTLDELRAKVAHYLAHEDERQRVAAAGMRKVHQAHTYESRLRGARLVITQFRKEAAILDQMDDYVRSDPNKAVEFAGYLQRERAIEQNLDNVKLLEARGHLARGRPHDAVTALTEALRLNPEHLTARELLAQTVGTH